MNRPTAYIIALLLLLLASQRSIVHFDQEIGRRFEDNGDITTVTEECGRTWNILFGDGSDLDGKGANFSADCERAARTRAAEAFGLIVMGGMVLGWALWLAPKVRRTPLHEVVRQISHGAIEVTGRPGRSGGGADPLDHDGD